MSTRTQEIDEKEAPSAEDSDVVIEDEIEVESEVESEQEVEESEINSEAEVDTAGTENEEETEVKSESENKDKPTSDTDDHDKPNIPYKRFKRQNDKVKELYAEIEALKAKVPQQEAKPSNDGRPQRPTEKDVEYDPAAYQKALEKYEDDLLEWKLDQRIKQDEANKAKARAEELRGKFAKSAEELFEKDAEYRNALMQADEDGEDLSIPPVVSEVMLESEVGHLIERELVVNREEMLPKLRSMNDRQRLLFLGRIEAEILSKNQMGNKQEPKKPVVSKAPKPQTDVKANTGKVDRDSELKKIYKDFDIE